MNTTDRTQVQQFDIAAIMGGLYGDGIIGLKGAFERQWVQELGEDIEVLFQDALKRPGGAVGRGPKRYYVEIHPEGIRGFLDLVTHPWVTGVCRSEEHTSELQSRLHLVCRLLLEKKKKK